MPGMNCAVAVYKNDKFKSIKEGKDLYNFTFSHSPKMGEKKLCTYLNVLKKFYQGRFWIKL